MKIVAIADMHIGKDRIGKAHVSPEKWDAPAWEAINYAVKNDVDLVLFLGDEFETRAPYPSTIARMANLLMELDENGVAWRIVGGNHTIGAGKDYTSSLDPLRMLQRDGVLEDVIHLKRVAGLNLIAIPWIRPVDYGNTEGLTIDEEISYTRTEALVRIDECFTAIAGEKPRPTLVAGHAMVSTGGVNADAPTAFLGKDIPLPLRELESYGVPVVLGHIHHPVGPYVGSTQPTDFGDEGDVKSFMVLEWGDHLDKATENGWYSLRIPYKSSLKVADIRIEEWPNPFEDIHIDHTNSPTTMTIPDIIRITIAGDAADPFEVRRAYEGQHTIESITVERERIVTARVETEQALVAMPPEDAARIWLEQGGEMHNKTEAMKRFRMLLQEDEAV